MTRYTEIDNGFVAMNYCQAKLAAVDLSTADWKWLTAAAEYLLSRINATDEDVLDACSLINRAAISRSESQPSP